MGLGQNVTRTKSYEDIMYSRLGQQFDRDLPVDLEPNFSRSLKFLIFNVIYFYNATRVTACTCDL